MLNRKIQALVKYIIIIYCWERSFLGSDGDSGLQGSSRGIQTFWAQVEAARAPRGPAVWRGRGRFTSGSLLSPHFWITASNLTNPLSGCCSRSPRPPCRAKWLEKLRGGGVLRLWSHLSGFINNFLITLKPDSCPLPVFIAGFQRLKSF